MSFLLPLLGLPALGLALTFGGPRPERAGFLLAGWGLAFAALLAAGAKLPLTFGPLRLDQFSILFLLLAGVLAGIAALASLGRQEENWYFRLSAFLVLALALAGTSDSLVLLWAGLEAAGLTFVLLVDTRRVKASLEAAWKTALLTAGGSLSSLLALGFLLAAAPRPNASWSYLAAHAHSLQPGLLAVAFALALVGFGTKLGLFPFHPWITAAYTQAPAPVVLLSAGEIGLGLYALLRYYLLAQPVLGAFADHLLLAAGVLSVAAGAAGLATSREVKQLLAYSTVEILGLALVGLGSGSFLGLAGALLLVVFYSLAKAALFLSAEGLAGDGGLPLSSLNGLLTRRPGLLAVFLLVGGFAALGLPPFPTFFGELGILAGLFRESPLATALLLVPWLVVFLAYLRFLTRLFSRADPQPATEDQRSAPGFREAAVALSLFLLLLGVVRLPSLLSVLAVVGTRTFT